MPFFRPEFLYDIDLDTMRSIEVKAGAKASFHNDRDMYFLAEGSADVFMLRTATSDDPVQRRPIFVAKVVTEELLFPFPVSLISPAEQFILIAKEDCVLRRIPRELIKDRMASSESAWASFDSTLDIWMEKLSHQLHLSSEQAHANWSRLQDGPPDIEDKHRELIVPWPDISLQKPVDLEPGTELYAGDHLDESHDPVHWLWVEEGELIVCNTPELTVKPGCPGYPMSFPFTFKTEGPAKVVISGQSRDVNEAFEGWNQFSRNYRHLLHQAAIEKKAKIDKELRAQAVRDRLTVDHSLRRFGELLEGDEYLAPVHPHEALKSVCEQLGHRLGITFIFPRDFHDCPTVEDQLHLLCWRSEIRYRRINLEADWRKHLHSPLLGFMKISGTPVLLSKEESGLYYVSNPVTAERRVIDQHTLQEIESFAYRFFREIPDEKTDSLRKVLKHLASGPERRNLWLSGILNMLLATIAGAGIPIGIQLLFDHSIGNRDFPMLIQLFCILAVVIVARGLFTLVSELSLLRLQGLMAQSLSCGVWSRILRLPPSFFRSMSTGDILKRVDAADEMIIRVGSMIPGMLAAVGALLYAALLLYYNVTLAGFVILTSIPFLCFTYFAFHYIADKVLDQLHQESGLHSFVIQTLLGISTIRSTSSENRIFSRWAEGYSRIQELAYQVIKREALLKIIARVVPTLVMGSSLLLLTVSENLRENMTFGTISAFLATTGILWVNISNVMMQIGEFAKVAVPWKRLQPILQAKPEFHSDHIASKLNGEIEFRNLTFGYSASSKPIVDNISLKIEAGDFVAFAGRSGCGKTTLIRLLTGFEYPDEGKIFVDGVNLHELNLASVRSQMGVVMQDASLTVSSIREFLQMGGADTEEAMWWALDFAGLRHDVEHLAMGIDTLITDQEGVFSTGQRQRLLIARALIGHPRIIIFDEATTALDEVSQQHVIRVLESLSITRIVITHRLDSIKTADKIFVVDDGEVVESGTYDELTKMEGVFGELLAETEEQL